MNAGRCSSRANTSVNVGVGDRLRADHVDRTGRCPRVPAGTPRRPASPATRSTAPTAGRCPACRRCPAGTAAAAASADPRPSSSGRPVRSRTTRTPASSAGRAAASQTRHTSARKPGAGRGVLLRPGGRRCRRTSRRPRTAAALRAGPPAGRCEIARAMVPVVSTRLDRMQALVAGCPPLVADPRAGEVDDGVGAATRAGSSWPADGFQLASSAALGGAPYQPGDVVALDRAGARRAGCRGSRTRRPSGSACRYLAPCGADRCTLRRWRVRQCAVVPQRDAVRRPMADAR